MGCIMDDNNKGIHAEAKRDSFALHTDFGRESMELDWEQLDELILLVHRLKTYHEIDAMKEKP